MLKRSDIKRVAIYAIASGLFLNICEARNNKLKEADESAESSRRPTHLQHQQHKELTI